MSALSFNTPGEREKSLWLIKKENDPAHSQWYIDRFKAMEAEGKDMAGESRLVNALAREGQRFWMLVPAPVAWVSSCMRWGIG